MIYLFLIGFTVAALVGLSLWALGGPAEKRAVDHFSLPVPAEFARNSRYLPLIRQALSDEDLQYLRSRVAVGLVTKARRERKRAALAHLTALRTEFANLQALARVVAALSPEVDSADEIHRLCLTAQFAWRSEMVALRVRCNVAPFRELRNLAEMVSTLNARLEAAVKDIAERAALAGEMASALDRRGLNGVS